MGQCTRPGRGHSAGRGGGGAVVESGAIHPHAPAHISTRFPKTETREIKILRRTRHVNMVNMVEVATSLGAEGFAKADAKGPMGEPMGALTGLGDRVGDVFMVFDYVDYDLAGLMSSGYK